MDISCLYNRPEFPKGRKGVGSAGCVREGQRGLVVIGLPPGLLNWKLLSLFFHSSQGDSCSSSYSVTGNLWSRLRIPCLPWPTRFLGGPCLSTWMVFSESTLSSEDSDFLTRRDVMEAFLKMFQSTPGSVPWPLSHSQDSSNAAPPNSPFIWQTACIDRYACSPCANQSSPPLILVVDAHLHIVPVLLRALSPPSAVSSLSSGTYHLFLFVYFYCGKI